MIIKFEEEAYLDVITDIIATLAPPSAVCFVSALQHVALLAVRCESPEKSKVNPDDRGAYVCRRFTSDDGTCTIRGGGSPQTGIVRK